MFRVFRKIVEIISVGLYFITSIYIPDDFFFDETYYSREKLNVGRVRNFPMLKFIPTHYSACR